MAYWTVHLINASSIYCQKQKLLRKGISKEVPAETEVFGSLRKREVKLSKNAAESIDFILHKDFGRETKR